MNAELVKIRKNKELKIQANGEIKEINPDDILSRIYSLNNNMGQLFNNNSNPNMRIEDYIEKIVENIYIVLDTFSEMGIYPDYFYDIYFKVNEEYRNLASQGIVDGRVGLYKIPGFPAQISYMMENGLKNNNYLLNPKRIKSIGEYYNEMVEFLHKYYLPCEVTTVDMCREMFTDIHNSVDSCINNLNISSYISDDIEELSRLLFEYIRFFGAIGINPQKYLDEEIERQKDLGKSK